MAYSVNFELPKRQLGKSDVEFFVKGDSELLGTLTVSKGALVWFPKGTTYGYKIGWRKFNKLMQENARYMEKR